MARCWCAFAVVAGAMGAVAVTTASVKTWIKTLPDKPFWTIATTRILEIATTRIWKK